MEVVRVSVLSERASLMTLPDWLVEQIDSHWFERYEHRMRVV